jgi:hypothetical protein
MGESVNCLNTLPTLIIDRGGFSRRFSRSIAGIGELVGQVPPGGRVVVRAGVHGGVSLSVVVGGLEWWRIVTQKGAAIAGVHRGLAI